ncbi:MAG: DNA-binding response regulator [Cytophagales bacterium]|nr:MAG: DNA-binding response regulator [Cytophagales bacterium]
MTLAILSTRRSTALSFATTAEKLGFSTTFPCVNADLFLTTLSANPQAHAILTTEYLQMPNLFAQIRLHTPCLVLCFLPEHVSEAGSPLALLDGLDLDAVCGLDELTDCLKTLLDGRHYQSSLLTTLIEPIKQDTLPSWGEVTPAEKDVLRLMLRGLKVPAMADQLCRSPYTIQTQKTSMQQKLGVSGGPGVFVAFVLINAQLIKKLL